MRKAPRHAWHRHPGNNRPDSSSVDARGKTTVTARFAARLASAGLFALRTAPASALDSPLAIML
jgi:hypothetical protein